MIEKLKSKDFVRRVYLISILGKIGPDAKAAVPALTEVLMYPSPLVRAAAGAALTQINGGAK